MKNHRTTLAIISEALDERLDPRVLCHTAYKMKLPSLFVNGRQAFEYFQQHMLPFVQTVGQQSQRSWDRPNPPLGRVKWSLRNNINLQQSGILLAMHFVAVNRERFLNNFYLKSKRAVNKAATEGPAAWVIPADTPRPREAAEMVNLLRLMGVEVHVALREFGKETVGTEGT